MTNRFFLITGFLFLMVGFKGGEAPEGIPKHEEVAFQPGENLTYKIRYNMYYNLNVGKVRFKIKEQPKWKNGSNCHRIVSKGKTFGFYDPIYKVRDHYETCMDFDNMTPNFFMRDVYEGGFTFKEKLHFDHQNNVVRDKKGKAYEIPGNTQDLLSAIYYARNYNFRKANPGDTALINAFIDDTTYSVGLRYKGKTKIQTQFGKLTCLKIKPILIVGRIFDSKYDMTLWVSDDGNKIPLRIESDLTVGAIRADLVDYENLKHRFSVNE